jgi:hypothetical protein
MEIAQALCNESMTDKRLLNPLTNEFKVKLIIKSDEKYDNYSRPPKGLTAVITVKANNCIEAENSARSLFASSSEINSMICSEMDPRDKWRFITDLKKTGIDFNEYCLLRHKEIISEIELLGHAYPDFHVATYKDGELRSLINLISIEHRNCPHESCGSKSDFECTISRIVRNEFGMRSANVNNRPIQLVEESLDDFIEDNVINWIRIAELHVIQLCKYKITFI